MLLEGIVDYNMHFLLLMFEVAQTVCICISLILSLQEVIKHCICALCSECENKTNKKHWIFIDLVQLWFCETL